MGACPRHSKPGQPPTHPISHPRARRDGPFILSVTKKGSSFSVYMTIKNTACFLTKQGGRYGLAGKDNVDEPRFCHLSTSDQAAKVMKFINGGDDKERRSKLLLLRMFPTRTLTASIQAVRFI